MSKEEIALELTKMSYTDFVKSRARDGEFNIENLTINLYNHYLSNIPEPEHDK